MHPPLDRPHPDCQDIVLALKRCHAENSKFLFWRCNETKFRLDSCFKTEKDRMLKEMTKNFAHDRGKEDGLIMEALGQTESFQDYLAKDKGLARAQQEKAESKSAPPQYSK